MIRNSRKFYVFCLFWTNIQSKRTTRAETEDHLWSADHSLRNAALSNKATTQQSKMTSLAVLRQITNGECAYGAKWYIPRSFINFHSIVVNVTETYVNINNAPLFPTHSVYVFRVCISHDSGFFPKQHKPLGICYRTVWFPATKDWVFKDRLLRSFRIWTAQSVERPRKAWTVRGSISAGARCSALVQTGHGGPPRLLHNAYRVSSPGVKRPGRGVDHPPPSSAEVKERVELYLFSPSVPSWQVIGRTLPFT